MNWMNMALSIVVGILGVMSACGTLMLPMLLDDEESTQQKPKMLVAVAVVLLAITCVTALVMDWVFAGGMIWLLLPAFPLVLVLVAFFLASRES